MRRISIAATLPLLLALCAHSRAQSIDDLNLQVHGYVTQGFVYSAKNNWNTTNSTDGSAAWTEAIVNLTVQPQAKLHVGVQARYSLLGNYGNAIALDWAQADYKFNDRLGIRAGKVKTPTGLLNDIQDVDPAYLWVLLPQSVYPIASRDAILALFGGVVYGTSALGESFGRVEYRAFAGERSLAADSGFLQHYRDAGLTLPNGMAGPSSGATLRWIGPIPGLTVGATQTRQSSSGLVTAGPYSGSVTIPTFYSPLFFGRYEHNRVMFAGEYNRLAGSSTIQLIGPPPAIKSFDARNFYAMASYRLATNLNAGLYYSSTLDRTVAVSAARYQKDWVLAARYDFNPYFYLKAEQHFTDGLYAGYSTSNNTNLRPNDRMTLIKLGVSF